MSNESTKPFLSIILAIESSHYLSALTLQSILSQTEKSYELIIVEKAGGRQDHHYKDYSQSIKRVFASPKAFLGQMFNKGLSMADGEYVQFLIPGDVYLGEKSFKEVREGIENQKKPDLFITSFLLRNGQPEVVHRDCSISVLKKGNLPSRFSCCYFKKSFIQSFHGFSKDIVRREGFDLFCRIFKKGEPFIGRLDRVVIDHEVQHKNPKETYLYLFETLKITNRYFGWPSALKWFFYYDHCQSFVWLYRSLVQVFLKNG